MAIKIARGTTGQAQFLGSGYFGEGCEAGPITEDHWFVGDGNSETPNGWSLSKSGEVTVPNDAALGFSYGEYFEPCRYVEEQERQAQPRHFFEFEVVCLTVEISATETNRDEAMGVVLLECRAIVKGGKSPYQYNWAALGGTIVDGQGTSTAAINFTPGIEGSVSVSVTDSSVLPCSDSDGISIPADPLEFTVSPQIFGGTGDSTGTRGEMRFTETVEAVANQFILGAPSTIGFQLTRPSGGVMSVTRLTGTLVVGSNPSKYQATWDTTRVLGRWNITVESPHKSNSASFKVDKRGQIVLLAQSWVGATRAELGSASANCNDLSAIVYNHLGLPLSGNTDQQYNSANRPCSGDGCLLFFNIMEGPPNGPYTPRNPWNASHVAIKAGGQRVNINSTTGGSTTVTQEAVDEGVNTAPPWYDPNIRSRSTVDLNED